MRNKANRLGLIFLATTSVYTGGAAKSDWTDGTRANAQAAAVAANNGHAANGAQAPPTAAGPGLYFNKAVGATDVATPAAPVSPASPPRAASPLVSPVSTATPAQAPASAPPLNAQPTAPLEPPIPIDNVAPLSTTASDPFTQTTVVDPIGPAGTTGRSVTNDDVNFNDNAGTVEIHVNDASLVEVLRMLSLQSQKNIIASKEVKGTVTANLYGVTVREALDAILTSNGYTFREEGNFIYVYTAQELEAQRAATRVRKTQVFRLYYTPVSTAVNMIKPVLSKDGEVAFSEPAHVGLESGSGDAGGNSHSTEDVMVVTDYEDQLASVQKVLTEIDKRPQQVLIEATILRATLTEDNALGVDFQVLGGVDFSGLTASKSSVGSLAGGGIQNSSDASGLVEHGATGVSTGFTNNVPAGGLQVGIVKNNIAMFLEALETVTDTTVLANPKILALNKQKGEVVVGREDGYVTSTTTDTATVQTVEFLQTGTRLIFRPFIGDDGYIRMEIHPEDSSGGLGQGNLPYKLTTEVTSNVMVRDGRTIVIGGLFREDSNSTRGQVPGLGNIPFAGALFRSQRDMTKREEIIILLTPHIIKDEAAYAELSATELARMEQLRVGVRRGMMGSGRERLAEGFYDSAVNEMDKSNPDRGRALWNLNAATNLNPKFLEAIELKQQLTQHQVSSVDNSTSRDFVRRMVMKDLESERNAASRRVQLPRPTGPTTVPTALPTTKPAEEMKATSNSPDRRVVTTVTSAEAFALVLATPATTTVEEVETIWPLVIPVVASPATRPAPTTQPTATVDAN